MSGCGTLANEGGCERFSSIITYKLTNFHVLEKNNR